MAQESLIPPQTVKVIEAAAVPDWARAPEAILDPPTAEQVRNADGIFADREKHEPLAGLLGLWTSAMVLHDLAVETLQTPEDDEEEERKKPTE